MNRKYLNYIVFLAIVALVVGLAVNHSRHMAALVADMAGNDRTSRVTAVQELVKGEQFMDSITGETVATRVRIVQALEDWGTKQAVTALVGYLKDSDRPVRDRITLALVAIGTKSADHLQEVVNGIKDGDTNVRSGCSTALEVAAQAGPPQSTALLQQQVPDARPADVARAVAGIRPEVAALVVTKVAAIIKVEAGARDSGGDVLGAIPNRREESVLALRPVLADKDEGARMGAASAMGKVGSKSAVPDLVKAMHTDTAQVRRVCIGSIALIADVSGEPALTEALNNANDDNEARAQAAVGLGKIATPSAVAILVRALSDDDLKVQLSAVSALGRAGKAAVTPLLAVLKGPNRELRLRAAQALAATGLPEANPGLVSALSSDDAGTRRAAADALAATGNAGVVGALVARLSDRDGEVAEAAARTLARLGTPARPALIAALDKPEPVCYLAAWALGRQGQDMVDPLVQAAARDRTVARWSIVALADAGGPKAAEALKNLTANPDQVVHDGAVQALKKLGVD